MRGSIKERLVGDIERWRTEGWIDGPLYETLAKRYEASRFGFERVLRYLGIIGGVIIVFGILGMVGALSQSLAFGLVMLMGIAAGSFWAGVVLFRDRQNRYPFSARSLLLLGMLFYGGALVLLTRILDMREGATLLFTGIAWIVPAVAAAYVVSSRFILTLALMAAFHWVGSWHQMFGRSTYAFSVQDPRAMIVFAVVVCLVGIAHDLYLTDRFRPFYAVYAALGLLYANMSFLILGIFDTAKLAWAIAGILFALVQIALGARLHRNLFTGFGVTFMGINLFTRYHEFFWDRLTLGTFFLVGGAVLLAVGIAFEWYVQRTEVRP